MIGPETSIPIPPSSLWNEVVNIRPGSNETVTLNPPIFSWFYAPGNPLNLAVDQNVYFYRFQADYTGTTNPAHVAADLLIIQDGAVAQDHLVLFVLLDFRRHLRRSLPLAVP